MKKITIIGASGFVGQNLKSFLSVKGYDVFAPTRSELAGLRGHLGIVVYIAGFGMCDSFPDKCNVIDANINKLKLLLSAITFDRLVYFSSTRVYMGNSDSDESSDLLIMNEDSRKLFNLTKLVGEELCLSFSNTVVVRPSNIYGKALKSPLFLPAIARAAVKDKRVDMYVTPEYRKDYISVDDICFLLEKIILKKDLKRRVYNLAAGHNVSAMDIATVLNEETEAEVVWHPVTLEDKFPITNISSLRDEFNFSPSNVVVDLKLMLSDFKKAFSKGEF